MASPRGFGIAVSIDKDVARKTAVEAESRGYTSFWTNNAPGSDGLEVLRQAGSVTSTIRLGVGVIPVHAQPPSEIIALSGKGTDREVPMNRLLLGVGAAGKGALDTARQGISALRNELDCEIFLAALGPKMCRLAGELADGVLFNWLTPDYARQSAELVREGAASAGRQTPRLMTYVRVSLGEPGLERMKKEAARYEGIPAYARHFERMGIGGVDASIAVNDKSEVQERLKEWDGVLDEIVIRSITASDTLEETLALVDAGAP